MCIRDRFNRVPVIEMLVVVSVAQLSELIALLSRRFGLWKRMAAAFRLSSRELAYGSENRATFRSELIAGRFKTLSDHRNRSKSRSIETYASHSPCFQQHEKFGQLSGPALMRLSKPEQPVVQTELRRLPKASIRGLFDVGSRVLEIHC